jgi:lipoprotein-anchoring transpeptidase ErfK/SrfK
MPRFFRGRLIAAAVALPLLASACTTATADTGAAVTVTARSTVAGSPPAGAAAPAQVAGPPQASGGASPTTTDPATSTPPSSTAASKTTASSAAASTIAVLKPRITTSPADGATGSSPIAPVTAVAVNGTLTKVSLTNPEGRAVKGALSADKKLWTSAEPLGYGRGYTLTSTAEAPGGQTARASSSFTTLKPAQTIYPSFFPNPDMKTVGVGQPMVVIFDKPPADKAAAEKGLSVKTVPAVTGSWFWWDDRTVHYRPKDYWKAGTKVTVTAKVCGAYGETDRSMTVTIGPSKIAKVDDATKQMQVFIDGKKVKTYPVSLGQNKQLTVNGLDISLVTPSGTYVAQEKYRVKQMTSASYGLPKDSPLGYDSKIPLAVRFSNEGIFVHSAPWSVEDQGVRNVSHGCINMPPAGGQWFYDNFSYGDILTVTGTSTRLAPDDGYGDWNLSWDKWLAGSALHQ